MEPMFSNGEEVELSLPDENDMDDFNVGYLDIMPEMTQHVATVVQCAENMSKHRHCYYVESGGEGCYWDEKYMYPLNSVGAEDEFDSMFGDGF